MRKVFLFALLLTALVGCEKTPKTEPAANDHVWQDQVQALDKARAAADKAGQTPEHLREAP